MVNAQQDDESLGEPSGGPSSETAIVVATHAIARLYLKSLVAELTRVYVNVRVVTFFNGYLVSDVIAGEIEGLGAVIEQYGPSTRTKRMTDLHKSYRSLRRAMRAHGPVDLFFANPNEALTNWIAFDEKSRDRYQVKLHLIPEGISNYYSASVAEHDRQSRLYRFSSRLLGIRFTENRGQVLAQDVVPYECYWYPGDPGIMGQSMPVRWFNLNKPELRELHPSGDWLFLGQPTSDAGAVAYSRVLHEALRQCEGQLHYKPHPHERLTGAVERTLEAGGAKVVLSSDSAEHLSLSYSTVVGVMSSALLNVCTLGWHKDARAVMDRKLLEEISERPASEFKQAVSAAQRAGVREFELGVE